MIKHSRSTGALLFLLSAMPVTASPPPSTSIEWQLEQNWKTKAKPLDMVHSLDHKKVFILGNDQQVHVHEAGGRLLGSIPVPAGTTGIDIEPRGNRLYLINDREQTFTSLSVAVVAAIDPGNSPFMGRADAPVVVTVFTDFE